MGKLLQHRAKDLLPSVPILRARQFDTSLPKPSEWCGQYGTASNRQRHITCRLPEGLTRRRRLCGSASYGSGDRGRDLLNGAQVRARRDHPDARRLSVGGLTNGWALIGSAITVAVVRNVLIISCLHMLNKWISTNALCEREKIMLRSICARSTVTRWPRAVLWCLGCGARQHSFLSHLADRRRVARSTAPGTAMPRPSRRRHAVPRPSRRNLWRPVRRGCPHSRPS
jgi:hypothetical protein